MPPRRNTRAAAAAAADAANAPTALPLDGCVVALSGTFAGLSHAVLQKTITELGGTPAGSVNKATTHLVTTDADVAKKSAKVKSATELGIHIVSSGWLQDCSDKQERLDESKYTFSASADGTADKDATTDSAKPATNGSRKRSASPDAAVTAAPAPAPDNDDDAPPSKKQKTPEESSPVKNSKLETAKPAPALGTGQIAKSTDLKVPLDDTCPHVGDKVYIDDDGVIWDASLNQTNASNNNNKFYRLQVLHSGGSSYRTWTRWGRVGERGQSATLGDGSVDDAIRQFCKKFRDKSGLPWESRAEAPKPGKYAFVERNYYDDSDDEEEKEKPDDKKTADAAKEEPRPPPECTLDPAVQKLMHLIFNQQYFAATMSSLNYDANKLPLGKLSKATITRGYQALKDLASLLNDPSLAANYGRPLHQAVEGLSNSYYSVIPHVFGRQRPPVINSQDMIKKEVELLESLSDMKDAELIMKLEKKAAVGDDNVHPLDKQYQGLNMEEMTPLDPSSTEFQLLTEYLMESRGATHGVNYTVENIFRIERAGETQRFQDSKFASIPSDRRLLWHGSRVTNFGGILSQGLRIAPPEAPVSGYMFGKGIYLADMSSKSAGYCCSYISDRTALLLLCEAELGAPMQNLVNASYNAGEEAYAKGMWSTLGQGRTGPLSWTDAEAVHPSLKGIQMPDPSVKPGETKVPNAGLYYNEYICYDVAQVRLRYLFRVKM
ncbi:hypothetical protein RI367_003292 [Sorochytrium milnesiophthora]